MPCHSVPVQLLEPSVDGLVFDVLASYCAHGEGAAEI
jgi:hypothetical protein